MALMKAKNWKPRGYNELSPYLLTAKPEKLVQFLESALAGKRLRVHEDEEGRIVHAEVKLGDSVLMIGDPGDGSTLHSHIHVYVPNVDAVFKKALRAKAKSVQRPVQKDDVDKRGGFTDPTGTVTIWVGTQVGPKAGRRVR